MIRPIKIKFQNGLNSENALNEILNDLRGDFEFIESETPDFIIFGPYGNNIPEKSQNYTRIGYFCENIKPDLSICEWAFGIPREEEINHPNYKRIQWHGQNPESLIKDLTENDIDYIINSKSSFCNFLYSNKVPYREEFFKQLSKYKKVDAPGKSMNNMPSIDQTYAGNYWERKKKFLSSYKFTIAFENYAYPGYQTEKLYDAMQENSLPIYAGDPQIGEVFNTKSFINTALYTKYHYDGIAKFLEKIGQQNFKEYRPQFFKSMGLRLSRKLKYKTREFKMAYQYRNLNFEAAIEKIIEIDKDDTIFANYLRQPWFNNNTPPQNTLNKDRWLEIFNSK
jgi:hypothetical protein